MEPKNALGKQYKKMFNMNKVSCRFAGLLCNMEAMLSFTPYGLWLMWMTLPYEIIWHFSITLQVKLHFTEKALRLVAKKAMAKNTGARGLRAILENILTEAMFQVCLDTAFGPD